MKKRKMAVTVLDETIAELVNASDHKVLAVWAADCAERVLPIFEENFPHDNRPRYAIEKCREWIKTGIFKMKTIREASLSAHTAARDVVFHEAAHSAARAAGQAAATAHVKGHARAAAIYAVTAVRDAAAPNDKEKAILIEREWQYQHLIELQDS